MFTECLAMLFAVSLHIGAVDKPNELHPVAGVACEHWSAGAFYNSERRVASWAAYRSTHGPVFIEAGIVTGYRRAKALPLSRVGISLPGMELFAAPGLGRSDDPVLILSAVATWDFN